MRIHSSKSYKEAFVVTVLAPCRLAALLVVMAALFSAAHSGAQGCILARSPQQSGTTGQGGMLEPGHYQITFSERHQYSYQHYVGECCGLSIQ